MIRIPLRWSSGVFLASVLLFLPACGKNAGDAGTPEENMQHFELHEIGSLYNVYVTEKHRAPNSVNELKTYEVGFPTGFAALQTGKCVAVWGVDLEKSANKGSLVLAYQKEVPTQGGLVLLANQTIKKMTPEEFKAAPKGKGA